MRTKYLPLLVVLSFAGCHQARPAQDVAPQSSPQASWYAPTTPLQASLWFSELMGDVALHVSRPAYVAVFMIQPGRGATMIYPRDPMDDNYLSDGLRRINVRWQMWQARGSWMFADRYRWGYPWGLGMLAPRWNASWGTWYDNRYGWGTPLDYDVGYFGGLWGGGGAGSMAGPTYLFMVASGEPLRTDAFLGPGMAYDVRFASFSPTYTMRLIENDVLLFPEYSNHTTATYVIWPVPMRPRLIYASMYWRPSLPRVGCPDGQVLSPVPGTRRCVAVRTGPPAAKVDTAAADTSQLRAPPAWQIPSLVGDPATGLPGRGPQIGLPVTPMPVRPVPTTPAPGDHGGTAAPDGAAHDVPAVPARGSTPAPDPDHRATGQPHQDPPPATPHKTTPKKRPPARPRPRPVPAHTTPPASSPSPPPSSPPPPPPPATHIPPAAAHGGGGR